MDVLIGLASNWDLLKLHSENKNRDDFNDGYYNRYFGQVKESNKAQKDIKQIMDLLDKGQGVALICFCSDYNRSHRGILGYWFEKNGYIVLK